MAGSAVAFTLHQQTLGGVGSLPWTPTPLFISLGEGHKRARRGERLNDTYIHEPTLALKARMHAPTYVLMYLSRNIFVCVWECVAHKLARAR